MKYSIYCCIVLKNLKPECSPLNVCQGVCKQFMPGTGFAGICSTDRREWSDAGWGWTSAFFHLWLFHLHDQVRPSHLATAWTKPEALKSMSTHWISSTASQWSVRPWLMGLLSPRACVLKVLFGRDYLYMAPLLSYYNGKMSVVWSY